MEKARFPMNNVNITQGYDTNGHKGTYALDITGINSSIEPVFAPFTGTIKNIISSSSVGNWYWFESNEEVLCANGEVTKLVMLLGHDNIVRHKIGDIINQGATLSLEGTSGNATGNHCHIEVGKGDYVGTWYQNEDGVYQLYNAVKPNEYLCIPDNYVIINDGGYNWIRESEVKKFKYRGHVENVDWQDWVNLGETCGTTGLSLRLEAIQIDADEKIQAKAHIQNVGWIDYGIINKNTVIGTTGESKRLECLCLKGNFKYRVHLVGYGWTNWTDADGISTLGSVGQGLRIEAIEIQNKT